MNYFIERHPIRETARLVSELKAMREQGWDVTLLAAPDGKTLVAFGTDDPIRSGCAGCGGEYDAQTDGCNPCHVRHATRRWVRRRTDARREAYALGEALAGYRPRPGRDKHHRGQGVLDV